METKSVDKEGWRKRVKNLEEGSEKADENIEVE